MGIKNGAVEVGCMHHGKKTTTELEKKIPHFIKKFPKPTDFSENFERQMETTKNIFVKNPLLFQDMQFMVDKFGNIHHMDFDRAFQGHEEFSAEWIGTCFGVLDAVVMHAHKQAVREEEERIFLNLL